MKFTLQNVDVKNNNKFAYVIAITMTGEMTTSGQHIDKLTHGLLKNIHKNGQFSGKIGQTLLLPAEGKRQPIVLVGCGKSLSINDRDYKKLLMVSIRTFYETSITSVLSTLTELTIANRDTAWKVKQAVEITSDALYFFNDFKSEKQPLYALKHIAFSLPEKKSSAASQVAFHQGIATAEGVAYTKNLANLPSNICNPTYLANQAKLLAKTFSALKVTVIEEKQMEKLGMGAFLSVTKGTETAAKLICVEYRGDKKKRAPIALVGKGITFDTGGLSLKPADAMVGMKYDMCGAATVLGTLRTAAALKLPINLVGFLATAENMPSGTASKPEDIVTSLSGQTIEIMNTDAEGRLVLCDTLTYAERYKPEIVIDIATLTGAVVIALGHHATGLLANNDELANELLNAGEQSYDRAWRLPLWEEYQEQLKSPFADMSNVGGRAAGAITAGCFLSRFAKKFKWAHLDVAGTAAMMSGNDRYATGRPVPLLTQFLINQAAKQI